LVVNVPDKIEHHPPSEQVTSGVIIGEPVPLATAAASVDSDTKMVDSVPLPEIVKGDGWQTPPVEIKLSTPVQVAVHPIKPVMLPLYPSLVPGAEMSIKDFMTEGGFTVMCNMAKGGAKKKSGTRAKKEPATAKKASASAKKAATSAASKKKSQPPPDEEDEEDEDDAEDEDQGDESDDGAAAAEASETEGLGADHDSNEDDDGDQEMAEDLSSAAAARAASTRASARVKQEDDAESKEDEEEEEQEVAAEKKVRKPPPAKKKKAASAKKPAPKKKGAASATSSKKVAAGSRKRAGDHTTAAAAGGESVESTLKKQKLAEERTSSLREIIHGYDTLSEKEQHLAAEHAAMMRHLTLMSPPYRLSQLIIEKLQKIAADNLKTADLSPEVIEQIAFFRSSIDALGIIYDPEPAIDAAVAANSMAPLMNAMNAVLVQQQAQTTTRPAGLGTPGSFQARQVAAATRRGIDEEAAAAASHTGAVQARAKHRASEAVEAAKMAADANIQARGQTILGKAVMANTGLKGAIAKGGYNYTMATVPPEHDTKEQPHSDNEVGDELDENERVGSEEDGQEINDGFVVDEDMEEDEEDGQYDHAANVVVTQASAGYLSRRSALERDLQVSQKHLKEGGTAMAERCKKNITTLRQQLIRLDENESIRQTNARNKQEAIGAAAAATTAAAAVVAKKPEATAKKTAGAKKAAHFVSVVEKNHPLAQLDWHHQAYRVNQVQIPTIGPLHRIRQRVVRKVGSVSNFERLRRVCARRRTRAEKQPILIRMSNSVVQNTATRPTMIGWSPTFGVTPSDWVTTFEMWAQVAKLKDADIPMQLKWVIGDVGVRAELETVVQMSYESAASYTIRLIGHFIQHYSPTEAELRSFRFAFQKIERGVGEHIDDFLQRFMQATRAAYPGVDPWNETVFDRLIGALGSGFQRFASNWVFARTAKEAKERDGTVKPFHSQMMLHSMIKLWFRNRNARDEHENNETMLANHKARQEAAKLELGDNNLTGLEGKYKGTYAKTDYDRAREGAIDAFTTPNPELGTLRKFDQHITEKRTLNHLAANGFAAAAGKAASSRPTQQPTGGGGGEKRKSAAQDGGASAKKKKVSFSAHAATTGRDAGDKPVYGPCPECCLGHDWEYCTRNMSGERGKIEVARNYLGTGPHPKATEEQKAAVRAKYGKIGKDVAFVEPTDDRMDTEEKENDDKSNILVAAKSSKAAKPPSKSALKREGGSDSARFARLIRVGRQGQITLTVPCALNGVPVTDAVADTGAHASLMASHFYHAHEDDFGPLGPPPTFEILIADNTAVDAEGTVVVALRVFDPETKMYYTRQQQFVVLQNLPNQCLMGMDMLDSFYYGVAFQNGHFTLRADRFPDDHQLRPITNSTKSPLRVVQKASIQPGSSKKVLVEYGKHLTIDRSQAILCTPSAIRDERGGVEQLVFPPHIQDANGHNKRGQYWLMVINTSKKVIELSPQTIIGAAQVTVIPQRDVAAVESDDDLHTGYDVRAVRIVYRPETGEQEVECISNADAYRLAHPVESTDVEMASGDSSSSPA
jgi:hypothetical protein